ncbi:hypothetical protein [Halorubrum persicum]|uniref:hypothetical protein n=1 Tax=Halorubrum persicum TaxID=1383844 RepID=UPI001181A312|nr:hypothetical protein [Halorubrum persicum]
MAEDLVGGDESVDCPECGKEYSGGQGLKTHLRKTHERSDDSSNLFLSEGEVFEKIAEDSSFDYKTVKRLISVAEIPEQFHAFVKIPEERSSQEEGEYRSEIIFCEIYQRFLPGISLSD